MTVPLLRVDDIHVEFKVKRQGALGKSVLRALNGVTFTIAPGETVALVGESGSGKSTAARAVLRLLPITSGHVELDGQDLHSLGRDALRAARRRMQMVFQDPYSSLDPSAMVLNLVGEPLRIHMELNRDERNAMVLSLLEQVGLRSEHMSRYSYEFSGGQRQRIAIARALALNPDLIVLDEAVSALDMSTQNQVLQLLAELRSEHNLAYLFISHDLGVVRWIADRTAVMYLGRIVEMGPTVRVHENPSHPYTRSLVSAMPIADPLVQSTRKRIVLQGDPPDPLVEISGCPFRTRCPEVMSVCAEQAPAATEVDGGGWVACHLVSE